MKRFWILGLAAFCSFGIAAPDMAFAKGCPPGLAKKDPACVPPGLAKKGLKRGDYYDRDYDRIDYPRRYDLPPIGSAEGYYRDGRIVYRVDEQTRRVIDWIILTDEILAN